MLRHIETTKLYYNEYLYALKCQNPLLVIFRSCQSSASWARRILDGLRPYFEDKQKLTADIPHHIREDINKGIIKYRHFRDAQTIYKCLSEKFSSQEFKSRIDWPSSAKFYANDKAWLLEMATRIECAKEFHQPDPKYVDALLQNGHIILVDRPPVYKWKVKFNSNKGNPNFAKWCKNNTDKIKISDSTIEYMEKSYGLDGCFMYVRDKSVLTLVTLMTGNNLGRTDELVYCKDLDK